MVASWKQLSILSLLISLPAILSSLCTLLLVLYSQPSISRYLPLFLLFSPSC
ncbi:hypothetical protein GYMLUDRAFT_617566 [Collybiopsis luxurians FD-317 M1]|uniref:Uncharacterized protein n=1 Tax=Collybiopsis luxurians FD-317 M1 TaxID=944289 RepID=A0A0D0CVJ0_9AGAR|nr:hypothetical protein GYMLUDRAFT_617566 [Collybiopsis luxurians FD-317 M1]